MSVNTQTGLFQRFVLPAAAAIQAPETFELAMLRRIYVQQQPQPGSPGKYIEVNIPTVAEDDVVDIGDGPIQITGQDHANVTLEVNNNLSNATLIPDMTRATSPMAFRDFYLAPMIEGVLRKVNLAVCNLVTTANFSVHTSIVGGADTFARSHLAQAWANLRKVGAPPRLADQTFVTSVLPYSNMLTTSDWIQEATVGEAAAAQAQQTARFAPAFNAEIAFDQQFLEPSAGAYAGLFFHRHAIALVPVIPPMEPRENVEETTYQVPGTGLLLRIQFGYDFREQGWILHVHAVFALAVTRPRFGSYLVTT